MASLSSIQLGIAKKLEDRAYRQRFFAAVAQDEIASQLRELREYRGLTQSRLAQSVGMKQSAISRLEQAGYSRWSLASLLRLADALDARIKIIFQPAEEAIAEIKNLESGTSESPGNFEAVISFLSSPGRMSLSRSSEIESQLQHRTQELRGQPNTPNVDEQTLLWFSAPTVRSQSARLNRRISWN